MSEFVTLPNVERGCGHRKKGGCYAETLLSDNGLPLENFLIDPVVRIDPDNFGLTPINMRVIESAGKTFVLDWVGENSYLNVTDDIEEIRRFGLSARLELGPDQYALLDKNTRILRVHAKAYIKTPPLNHYWASRLSHDHHTRQRWTYCPQNIDDHLDLDNCTANCIGILWEDAIGIEGEVTDQNKRFGTRQMPAFTYVVAHAPDGLEDQKESYAPGIYISLPINQIAVVRDNDKGTHEAKLEKLAHCKLPVYVSEY